MLRLIVAAVEQPTGPTCWVGFDQDGHAERVDLSDAIETATALQLEQPPAGVLSLDGAWIEALA